MKRSSYVRGLEPQKLQAYGFRLRKFSPDRIKWKKVKKKREGGLINRRLKCL